MSLLDTLPDEKCTSDHAEHEYQKYFDRWFEDCLYKGFAYKKDQQIFEIEEYYYDAEKILKNIAIPNNLFCLSKNLDSKKDLHWLAGIYASAAFNLSSKEVIFIDSIDSRITQFGYKTPRGKKILNFNNFDRLGDYSSGIIVNHRNVETLGYRAVDATIINKEYSRSMGYESTSSALINLGRAILMGTLAESPFIVNYGGTYTSAGICCVRNSLIINWNNDDDCDFRRDPLQALEIYGQGQRNIAFLNFSSNPIDIGIAEEKEENEERSRYLQNKQVLLRQLTFGAGYYERWWEKISSMNEEPDFFMPLENMLQKEPNEQFFGEILKHYNVQTQSQFLTKLYTLLEPSMEWKF